MIRINLATRKQAVALNPAARPKLDLDLGGAFKDPVIRRSLLALAVCVISYWLLGDYQEKALAEAGKQLEELQAETVRLQHEGEKLEDYKALMKTLSEDETLLRTKLDVLRTLVADRNVPPKILMALSEALTEDSWLTELKLEDSVLSIYGAAADFNRISDIIRHLSESTYFSDVTLKDSEEKIDRGSKVAYFYLSAKRRK